MKSGGGGKSFLIPKVLFVLLLRGERLEMLLADRALR